MPLHIVTEAERCLNCKKPMCQQYCPVHTPIPQIIQLFKGNKLALPKTVKVGLEAQCPRGNGGMRSFSDVTLECRTAANIRAGK